MTPRERMPNFDDGTPRTKNRISGFADAVDPTTSSAPTDFTRVPAQPTVEQTAPTTSVVTAASTGTDVEVPPPAASAPAKPNIFQKVGADGKPTTDWMRVGIAVAIVGVVAWKMGFFKSKKKAPPFAKKKGKKKG